MHVLKLINHNTKRYGRVTPFETQFRGGIFLYWMSCDITSWTRSRPRISKQNREPIFEWMKIENTLTPLECLFVRWNVYFSAQASGCLLGAKIGINTRKVQYWTAYFTWRGPRITNNAQNQRASDQVYTRNEITTHRRITTRACTTLVCLHESATTHFSENKIMKFICRKQNNFARSVASAFSFSLWLFFAASSKPNELRSRMKKGTSKKHNQSQYRRSAHLFLTVADARALKPHRAPYSNTLLFFRCEYSKGKY